MQKRKHYAELSESFRKFPGIGQRQADRFSHFIAGADPFYVKKLIENIENLKKFSKQCEQCYIYYESDGNICEICAEKDSEIIIVVEKDVDAHSLMKSMEVENVNYFILGGLIPIARKTRDAARTSQLIETISLKKPREVVLALSVHPDADHTIEYLANELKTQFPTIKITTLGRGLSSGSELEYLDPNTIDSALKGRNDV